MKIIERYASAVRSHNLSMPAASSFADADVLAAMGLAARRHELAVELARVFSGDVRGTQRVVHLLAQRVERQARQQQAHTRVRLRPQQAQELAQACLAWERDGRCPTCCGQGYELVSGTSQLSDTPCPDCQGSGKLPLEPQFEPRLRPLVNWLIAELQSQMQLAGPVAMRALGARMSLDGGG